MIREISLPLQESISADLKAGDEVALTGFLLTGRDQACAKLAKMMHEKAKLPVELNGQVLYFVGPSPARPDGVIGSAGPTTSGRMATFIPTLLECGLRGLIGKGYLDTTAKASLVAHRAVYFGAIGGTGALLSACIKSSQVIAFPELLSEAVHLLKVERFPAVVLYDTNGGDLYAHALRTAAD